MSIGPVLPAIRRSFFPFVLQVRFGPVNRTLDLLLCSQALCRLNLSWRGFCSSISQRDGIRVGRVEGMAVPSTKLLQEALYSMIWLQIQNFFSCFKVACGHSRLASLPPPSWLFSQASFSVEQTFFFHISVADWKNWDGPPIEFAASLMSMSLMKEALSHQSSNKIGYHVFISRFFLYPPWVTGFRVYCPSGTVPGIIVGWTRLWLKTSKVTSLCTASPNKQIGKFGWGEGARSFSFMIGQSFHFASGQWQTLFPLHL